MSKVKRGGYIFITWIGDHSPRHVHVFKGDKLIAKVDVARKKVISGCASAKVMRYLEELLKEGAI